MTYRGSSDKTESINLTKDYHPEYISDLKKTQQQKTNNTAEKWAKDSNRKEEIQMAKKYMENCLLLVSRDVQMKTMTNCHLTPVRMAEIQNPERNKCS